MEFTVHQSKTQFSKLLALVEAGEEVLITKGREKTPVAKLVAYEKKRPIKMGWLKGKMAELTPDSPFFDPLPEEELRLWNGEGD